MEAISNTESKQTVTQPTPAGEAPPESTGTSEFETFLRSNLTPDPANEISEEDLFAALVQERIQKTKGDETLTLFKEQLEAAKVTHRQPSGFSSLEDATKTALQGLASSGKLSAEEVGAIYSQSFKAAQLDGNLEALFDGRGDANDPTRAVASLEAALLGARTSIESFDSGELVAASRAVGEESFGHNRPAATTGGARTGSANPVFADPRLSLPDLDTGDNSSDREHERRNGSGQPEL